MKRTVLPLAVLLTVAAQIDLSAATLYWDNNGATAGAGTGGVTTVWNTASVWTTDPAGGNGVTPVPGAWVSGSDAVFSAGNSVINSITVSPSAAVSANSITVEEARVFASGSAVTLASGGGGLTINSGATYAIADSTKIVGAAVNTPITLNGGTIESTLAGSGVNSFVNATGFRIFVSGTGGTLFLSTPQGAGTQLYQPTLGITGSGGLTIKGNATALRMSTPATYTGPTTITATAGSFEFRQNTTANALPTTTDLTINSSAVFNLNGADATIASLSGTGTVAFGVNRTLTVNGSTPANDTTFSGVIQDSFTTFGAAAGSAGRLTKNGTSSLTLSGSNVQTGITTLAAGTLTVSASGTLSGATAPLTVNGGTLNLNNAAQTVSTFSGGGGTVNLGTGHTLTSTAIASSAFSGTIAGAGGFTKTDSFNQTLSGPNSYDGVTAISGTGTITVLSATGLGSTVGKTTVANGAGLNFNGGTTLTINEAIDIAGVGNTVATGGAINVGTAGTVITFGGPITLTADASVGSSGAAGTSVTFSNAAAFTGLGTTLTLNGAAGTGTKTISGAIALGIGGLTKLQSGTWVLSGTNTYNGATSISAGTLVAASNAALGSAAAGTTVASPAALGFQGNINYSTAEGVSIGGTGISSTGAINNISGTNSFAGAITMTADSSVGVTAGSLELSGGISGSAINLTKVGTGTLTLSGATTYSGTTTVSAGTLSAAAAGALGSTTSVTVNTGGTLLLENALTDRINDSAAIALSDGTLRMPALSGGTSETVGALTLSGTSTLDFNTLNTNTIQFASLTTSLGYSLRVDHWTGTIYQGDATTDPNTDSTQDRYLLASATLGTEFPDISFYSDSDQFIGFGKVVSFGSGYELVPVPEPTAVFGALALLGLAGYRERRRAAALRRASRQV